jgi:hypothetical protein
MRGKLLFLLILAMLVGLVYLVGTRTRDAHVMPRARPAETHEAGAPPTATPPASDAATTTTEPADASVALEARAPLLDRPLRIVASSWELAAALVVANGGTSTADGSAVRAEGLDARVDVVTAPRDVESQLARGGADPAGADVAVVPLPWLVTSYERIRALEPQIVHVVGWSHGREVLFGSKDGILSRPGPLSGDVTVFSDDPSATAFALYALDAAGTPASHVRVVTDPKGATLAALARPLASDRSSDLPTKILLTTADASRLIPFVAVTAGGFAREHAAAVTALLVAWDKGATQLHADVPAAARRIAAEKNAPEPSALLERLGWTADPGREDEGHALGLLGSDAGIVGDAQVTVGVLFAREWQLLRDASALSSPAPEAPPVDTAPYAMAFPATTAAPPPALVPPGDGARVLLAQRVTKGDADAIASRAAFLADVFERSPLRITTRPTTLAKDAADAATARYRVPAARIVVATTPLADPGVALIEVLAIP